jgi:methyl-accepting chemotaxis protein
LLCLFPVDYGAENFLKRLSGRTNVEDALEELDTLTKEEISMVVVRNLEVTHRVDGNAKVIEDAVQKIDRNINATKELTQVVDSSLEVIEKVIRDVDGNVKATKEVTHEVDGNVQEIKELTRDIGNKVKTMNEVVQGFASRINPNVKAMKNGMKPFLLVFFHVLTFVFLVSQNSH